MKILQNLTLLSQDTKRDFRPTADFMRQEFEK